MITLNLKSSEHFVLYSVNIIIVLKEVTILKKFSVSIASFITLFIAFQILSGLILTATFTPNFTLVTKNVSQEVSFGNALNPLLLVLLTATVAYFLSQKICKISKTQAH